MLQDAIQAFQGGNFDRADSILRKVIEADAHNLPALHVLGLIKASQQKFREAADLLGRAVQLNPGDASIHYNLAKALMDCGSFIESIQHHHKCLELTPDNPEAWLNFGKTLSNLSAYPDALQAYDRALAILPNYLEALVNKGATLKELRRFDEAIACADRALQINPNLAEGWANKGVALKESTQYEEVIRCYEKALSIKPNIDWLLGDLLHTKMKIGSWSNLDGQLQDLLSKMRANEKAATPFALLGLIDDAQLLKKSAEIYAADKYPTNPILGPIAKRDKREKIRIGYYSADFHNHATGILMAELFELHDKTQFELIGFSFGPIKNDEMRQRLQKSFDQFIEVGSKPDVEIAQLSRNLEIDIAIDLKGYTQDSRAGIFSYRAAPIQVNYLGYPGTMGAPYIDYIIADKTLIPIDLQGAYSEKVAYLPGSYQVNDSKRVISDKQFIRQELGLPETGFVYCCFNNNYKIMPTTFDSWMHILKAVQGSVLWLLEDNALAAENLQQEAEKRGVDRGRLVFAKRLLPAEHLARHQLAGLMLDTFPCNAHTTASDALWSGLPVLTLAGESFASRVAASLVNAVELSNLITSSEAEYEALAVELGNNPQKLAAIKQKLSTNLLSAPLFDTALFTKNLEAAYVQMYKHGQEGLAPTHLSI